MSELRNDRPAVPAQSVRPPARMAGDPATEPTIGALVHDLSAQLPELIRSELRLAQAELGEKGKRVGMGLGAFSAAGLVAYFGVALLVVTAVLALALVLPAWASALIVGVLLLGVAGVLAVLGKKKVDAAAPLKPERAMTGVQEDIATVKGER